MLFCQLGRAQSLREISGSLRSCEGKLKHLGIQAPGRSTLAYANQHRPREIFQLLFEELLKRCQNNIQPGQRKFRFKNKLYSLDSTIVDLCLSMYDWAHYRRTRGRSSCIYYWIMMVTCPLLPLLQKARLPISRSPNNYSLSGATGESEIVTTLVIISFLVYNTAYRYMRYSYRLVR